MTDALLDTFDRLHDAYGPQGWWPGETPFEIMVGAILTQNTAWTNVERAIAALVEAGALDPGTILALPEGEVAALIRPAGYFNVKARRLRNFCRWYVDQGGHAALATFDTAALRAALLSVNGVGPETADDILLYAFERPVFVIDAYTRRLFSRLGLVDAEAGYETLRLGFEEGLERALRRAKTCDHTDLVGIFNEYHALIVAHAKSVCRPRPLCDACVLATLCPVVGATRKRAQGGG